MVSKGPEFESKFGDYIEEGLPIIFLKLSRNMVDKLKYKTNNGQDGVSSNTVGFYSG
jgi:hypothetical protein